MLIAREGWGATELPGGSEVSLLEVRRLLLFGGGQRIPLGRGRVAGWDIVERLKEV
jgi:hypothetical protein